MNRLLFPELGPEEVADGWLPDLPPMTASQVLDAVAKRHPMTGYNNEPGRWVFVREVCAAIGTWTAEQRFDAVAIGLTTGSKFARVVYEVKVSRADWLRELKPKRDLVGPWGGVSPSLVRHIAANPDQKPQGWELIEYPKWQAALDVSTEFWYAAPPRCILPEELPAEAGLLEVRLFGSAREPRTKVIRQAPIRETPNPSHGFWAAVIRRAAGFAATSGEAGE